MAREFGVSVLLSVTLMVQGCGLMDIKPQDTGTDFALLNRHAELANLAYAELPVVERDIGKLSCKLVKTNKQSTDEVQYFLARDNARETDVIAVRGTASVEDALVDMQFQLKRMELLDINMHQGFSQAAMRVFDEIKPQLDKKRAVDIVGHSLGGAVALSLGMILDHEGYRVGVIHTYGQPKVTDREGSARFAHLNVIRVVTDKDVVPLVPPAGTDETGAAGFYWHFGQEVVVFPGIYYALLNEPQVLLRQAANYVPNLVTERELGAHAMDNYLGMLNPKIKRVSQIAYGEKNKLEAASSEASR